MLLREGKIKDRRDLGTVSFSLLGVLLILLSIIAAAYISRLDRMDYENELKSESIEELESISRDKIETINSRIHQIAVESAFRARGAPSNISDVFHARLDSYFTKYGTSRGLERDGVSVNIKKDGYDLTIGKKTAKVDEVVPDMRGGGRYAKVSTDSPGTKGQANESFCYQVEGGFDLTVRDTDSGLKIRDSEDVSMTVDVPYPFLKRKSDSFSSSLKGGAGHVGRMTNYILKTVAQYRTLAGYGMRSDGGIDCSEKPGTDEIVTEEDVELAVNLALILEIAYQYRGIDPEQVDNLTEEAPSDRRGRIRDLLSTYVSDGRIDPADIVSLYYGYGYDNETVGMDEARSIDLTSIMVQSINALVDQFILKYFDKTGLMKLVNALYKGYQMMEEIWEEMGETCDNWVDFLTGDDEDDEINPKQVKLVKNWAKFVFISAGLSNTKLIRSDYTPFKEFKDVNISGYPELPSNFSEELSFKYVKKLTSEEHRWYEYSCGHGDVHREHGHTCNETVIKGYDEESKPVHGKCGAKEELVGFDYMVGRCNVTVHPGPISFQPTDIMNGYDYRWQDFYDDHFKKEMSKKPDNIRGAVKDIIQEIVESIMEEDEIQRILEKYRKVEINPRDRSSLFKDMKRNVNSAVGDVIDFYRNDPGEISDIIERYLHPEKGDPGIQDLKDFIQGAFDHPGDHDDGYYHPEGSIFDKDFSTASRTAKMLLDEDSPHLDYETDMIGISRGKLSKECDEVEHDSSPSYGLTRDEVSDLLINGGSKTNGKGSNLKEDLIPVVKEKFKEIIDRELKEYNKDPKRSGRDGLILQALDFYQYNTSVEGYAESYSKGHSTRGYSTRGYSTRGEANQVWIESITPDPATKGEDTVSFIGNTTLNFTSLEWRSDKDGALSDELRFNQSALFMTQGEHDILLSMTDEDGIIHTASETIYINLAPDAVMEGVPEAAAEMEEITFESASSDVDGTITGLRWDFGDGTNATGVSVKHTYTAPGSYGLKLTVTDDKGASDSASKTILIDDAPRVVDHSPGDTDGWSTDQPLNITFSERVDPSSLRYDIQPYASLDGTWSENNTLLTLLPSGYYDREESYELVIDDVKDVDNGTNSSILSSWSLGWNTESRGTVTSWLPGDNGTLNLQSTLVLTLSEPAYISGSVDELISQDHGWRANWSDGGRRLKLDHEPFSPSTDVDLDLDLTYLRASQDASRFKHSGGTSYNISFTTEGKDPPLLLSTDPVNGSENVSLDSEIVLEFDEEINTSSFRLDVYPGLGNITYTWNDGNDSVKVGHDDPFLPDRRYTFFVRCNDTDGNVLRTIQGDSNSTNPLHLSTVDPDPPEIVQMVPNDGTDHYLADAPLVIVFNESIKEGSVEFNCTPSLGNLNETWNPQGTILTLEHDDLESGETYRVTIEDAVDLNGNSMEGNRTVEFTVSRNGKNIGSNLFQKKVWTFIGGGPIGGSLFDMTERILKETTSEMILSSNMKNTEYRVPLNMEGDYSYHAQTSKAAKELELLVDICPNYLNLSEGIDISSPSGHHYTNIAKISSRPFETSWDIKVKSRRFFLNVSKKDPYYLEGDVRAPLFLNGSHGLAFNLSLTVASGWKLSGVDLF